jgi:two-component system phosphate regulon response regulator PhoB
MPTVLVVEDESAIAELIAINLRHAGFEVTLAETADQALVAVDAVLPDLVLLDWMLPGQSGVTLARRWRADARTKELPIIMLTARADETDKVAGLDAGADDYLTAGARPGLGRPCVHRGAYRGRACQAPARSPAAGALRPDDRNRAGGGLSPDPAGRRVCLIQRPAKP